MNETCRICGSNQWTIAYNGSVRHGTFGNSVSGTVYRCKVCEVEFMPPHVEDLNAFYQSGAYREEIGEQSSPTDYFNRHDSEQLRKYPLLENIPLRGIAIADVGSAGGSFLDGIRGFAAATVAIEPASSYHSSLRERGHQVYTNTTDALQNWRGRLNLVTCFSVIEHVADPVALLRDIRALLTDDGVLVLSTPNRRDVLLEIGSEQYKSFFYRTAHTFYFGSHALQHAAAIAGFSSFQVRYVHRFNFANFVTWLHGGKPSGNAVESVMGSSFDDLWKTRLEEQGIADYLYAYLRQ